MKYVDYTFPTPEENLACDEALLDACEEGLDVEILRFWEPTEPFVVLGYANQAASEVNLPPCEADGVPILRRCSGGGTVLQARGCLNYSLILRIPESGALATITGANKFIMERNAAAVAPLAPGKIGIQGYTDLTIENLKFSGNAQRRRRKFLIFHGTFLLQMDLMLVGKYLRMPSRQPDYRENRPHKEFLTNLELAPDAMKLSMQKKWEAAEVLTDLPKGRIAELTAAKYSTKEWNFRS